MCLTNQENRHCFNPRTHIGCDLHEKPNVASNKFQSTHPHRVRLAVFKIKSIYIMFQSTHPHRVRHIAIGISIPTASFNPRTHIGCDVARISLHVRRLRFQSTHPHRVRQRHNNTIYDSLLFQSTHPHRVRRCKDIDTKGLSLVSIHAPT